MNLHDEISNIVQEYLLSIDALTKEQLIEAIVQAVKAGDFLKYVMTNGNHAQNVVYIPFQEVETLRSKLAQFQVFGTSECKNCEDGKITLYCKRTWCYDCLEMAGLE